MKINNGFCFNGKPQAILLCLLGLFFAVLDVMAMDLPKQKDTIFVYEKGTSHVLAVPRNACMLSEYLKGVIVGSAEFGSEKDAIKIELDFPFPDIKKSFDLIKIYSKHKNKQEDQQNALGKLIKTYQFHDLIGVANCIDSLMCPPVIKKLCLRQIKEFAHKTDKNIFTDPYFGVNLQQLSLSLQESLFLEPSILNLKRLIDYCNKDRVVLLKKDKGLMSYFKKEIYEFENSGPIIAWSPDETKICTAGQRTDSYEVNLWDISDQKNITCQILLQNDASSINFSPDSKKIAIDNCDTSSVDIWDISLGHLIGRFNNPGEMSESVFAQDSTNLFTTTYQDNLVSHLLLGNITDGTSKTIAHNFTYLRMPVVSHDGKTLAVAAYKNNNSFIALFNITDLDNITLVRTIPLVHPFKSFAFSPNDQKIVCAYTNKKPPYNYWMVLLDISNLNNISAKYLKDPGLTQEGFFETVAFTPDGENILVAGESNKNNPILGFWDISGDSDDYTFHYLGFGKAVCVAPSFTQGCRIAYFDELPQIQTLWTKEEIIAFNQLKQCNVDQIRLVYALSLRLMKDLDKEVDELDQKLMECKTGGQVAAVRLRHAFSSKKEIELDEEELSVFVKLPQKLRELLESVLNIKKKQ